MAYALVGTLGAAAQGAATVGVLAAWGQTPTAGNLLIIWCANSGLTTFPTTPSGWSVAVQASGTSVSGTILYKIAAGGDAAVTVGGASGTYGVQAAEFSGGSGIVDQNGNGAGTSSPVTATLAAADAASGELLVMCASDRRSAARTPSDTWTSNHGTVTQAGSNNAVSSTDHYSFGYLLATTSNAGADTAICTLSITTSLTGANVVAATFKLPLPVVIPEIVTQPLQYPEPPMFRL